MRRLVNWWWNEIFGKKARSMSLGERRAVITPSHLQLSIVRQSEQMGLNRSECITGARARMPPRWC